MASPFERLRTLNRLHNSQLQKQGAMVKKMKDQAEAAAAVSQELKGQKE